MKQHLELTARLQAVAELVPLNAALADIGTDHAYLPTWLLLRGSVRRAIAADINRGPLDRAKSTACQYGCEDRMDFRLCDGLAQIGPEEADTIVIAGMGGETIAGILQAAPWTKDARYTLILQPMSAQNDLRRWLSHQGYGIEKEVLVREGDKLYNIIAARFGNPQPMTLAEEWAGRQSREEAQPLRGEYLSSLLEKTRRSMEGISRGKAGEQDVRLCELRTLWEQLEQMKKEWDEWQQ